MLRFYNYHHVDEHFHKSQSNLWSQGQTTAHQREIGERRPPGLRFSNERYVSGRVPGSRSIRRSGACDALAEMLSERATQAISPVSVSPSGALWLKIEQHVLQQICPARVSLTSPSPSGSRNALPHLRTSRSR